MQNPKSWATTAVPAVFKGWCPCLTRRRVSPRPQVSPPNQQHKKRCMLGLLKDAVEVHNAELARLLGDREMHLIVETEDFGVTWKAQKNKIPAFAMCTGARPGDRQALQQVLGPAAGAHRGCAEAQVGQDGAE